MKRRPKKKAKHLVNRNVIAATEVNQSAMAHVSQHNGLLFVVLAFPVSQAGGVDDLFRPFSCHSVSLSHPVALSGAQNRFLLLLLQLHVILSLLDGLTRKISPAVDWQGGLSDPC